jgi:hypothetical protein
LARLLPNCGGGVVRSAATKPVAVEMVTAAAIKAAGKVWTLPRPARHADVRRHANRELLGAGLGLTAGDHSDFEEGFVTSHREFVNREEAGRVAFAAKQLLFSYDSPPFCLQTPDLW